MFLSELIAEKGIVRKDVPPPSLRPKSVPVPVTEKEQTAPSSVPATPVLAGPPFQWQPIPVDETPEEKEAKCGAAMFLMSVLKTRADPKGFLASIPKPSRPTDSFEFRPIETTEDYYDALELLEDFS
jgi:hypothetical protein